MRPEKTIKIVKVTENEFDGKKVVKVEAMTKEFEKEINENYQGKVILKLDDVGIKLKIGDEVRVELEAYTYNNEVKWRIYRLLGK